LADDDEETARPTKIPKIVMPVKATDLLAGPSATRKNKMMPLVRPKSSNNPPAVVAPKDSVAPPKPALGGLSLLGSYSDSSESD